MKIQFDQTDLFEKSVLAFAEYGIPLNVKGYTKDTIFIRVKPVNYLLNSTLVNDSINRGKVFLVNLNKGILFITEGDREYVLVNAELKVSTK